jgi:SAM-dependent methyltransferase
MLRGILVRIIVVNGLFRRLSSVDPAATCSSTEIGMSRCMDSSYTNTSHVFGDCACNKHAFCFLGACYCHPGYDSSTHCTKKLPITKLNPWQSKGCLALKKEKTFYSNMSLENIGAEFHRDGSLCPKYIKSCAYLCFSHITYGVAVVPRSLWLQAQQAEAALWKSIGKIWKTSDANDRALEHWEAFDHFSCLSESTSLGEVIEVGAGPWTQIKGFLKVRPDFRITKLTIAEPLAHHYISEIHSCSYATVTKLNKWDKGTHEFPVRIMNVDGQGISYDKQYDTLISVNVLEHVQSAFDYLSRLFTILKPGGLLIFHDRYYLNSHIMDGDIYHPIRIKRRVLDRFLMGFDIIFNNCSAHYDNRQGEMGYYVIAVKKT